jgi:hypothetical protein
LVESSLHASIHDRFKPRGRASGKKYEILADNYGANHGPSVLQSAAQSLY